MLLCLVMACCKANRVDAQTVNTRNRVHPQSVFNVGLLNGSNGSSAMLQAIIGTQIRHSFVGVGAGIDYYRFRSIPIFADFRQEFGKNKKKFFLYADAGYHRDWLTENNIKQYTSFFSSYDFKGGIYYDAGLGLKVGWGGNSGFLLSGGFSYKRMKNEVKTGICPIIGPCYGDVQKYSYSMPRMVIKAGVSL